MTARHLCCFLLQLYIVFSMLNANLTVADFKNLLLSRKLVWFTDDGICGGGYMTCTWGKYYFLNYFANFFIHLRLVPLYFIAIEVWSQRFYLRCFLSLQKILKGEIQDRWLWNGGSSGSGNDFGWISLLSICFVVHEWQNSVHSDIVDWLF